MRSCILQEGTEPSSYKRETGLPWPLLTDEQKRLYTAYDMSKAGFMEIWGGRTWWSYLLEMAHRGFPKKSNGDIYQQGGDILIDPTGIIRLHHVGRGPADRPPVESFLAIIQ